MTDDAGQTASATDQIQVLPLPPSGQINGDYLGIVGQPVTLYFAPAPNYSVSQSGPLTYRWE